MSTEKDKYVLILAPFFNSPGHVGNYRINRFIKWFEEFGYKIVVISSGDKGETHYGWGVNYREKSTILSLLDWWLRLGKKFYPVKVVYIIAKTLLKIILIPDEEVLWVRKVASSKNVKKLAKSALFIMGSSPLESVHVASLKLHNATNTPYIVDLRDGWLDEPLKYGFILKIKPRTSLEQKLERTVYQKAYKIIANSMGWRRMLLQRYPQHSGKTFVLTNAYPRELLEFIENAKGKTGASAKSGSGITLLYSGRLRSSSNERKVQLLLEPFKLIPGKRFVVRIVGEILKTEKEEIKRIKSTVPFEIICEDFMPREKLYELMLEVDGLILLNISQSAIPTKLFEYILVKKPVLAISTPNSSVTAITHGLPQFFHYELGGDLRKNQENINAFLKACETKEYDAAVPDDFYEDKLKAAFFSEISNLVK